MSDSLASTIAVNAEIAAALVSASNVSAFDNDTIAASKDSSWSTSILLMCSRISNNWSNSSVLPDNKKFNWSCKFWSPSSLAFCSAVTLSSISDSLASTIAVNAEIASALAAASSATAVAAVSLLSDTVLVKDSTFCSISSSLAATIDCKADKSSSVEAASLSIDAWSSFCNSSLFSPSSEKPASTTAVNAEIASSLAERSAWSPACWASTAEVNCELTTTAEGSSDTSAVIFAPSNITKSEAMENFPSSTFSMLLIWSNLKPLNFSFCGSCILIVFMLDCY